MNVVNVSKAGWVRNNSGYFPMTERTALAQIHSSNQSFEVTRASSSIKSNGLTPRFRRTRNERRFLPNHRILPNPAFDHALMVLSHWVFQALF